MQVYLILDEFIMGGEIQETSKKVGSLSSTLLVHCSTALVCRDKQTGLPIEVAGDSVIMMRDVTCRSSWNAWRSWTE